MVFETTGVDEWPGEKVATKSRTSGKWERINDGITLKKQTKMVTEAKAKGFYPSASWRL